MFALFQSINGVIDKLGSIADRKAYNGYLTDLCSAELLKLVCYESVSECSIVCLIWILCDIVLSYRLFDANLHTCNGMDKTFPNPKNCHTKN